MSGIFSFSGDEDFFSGGTMHLSPGSCPGVYLPPRKRQRVAAPSLYSGFEQKQTSIEVLPDECLFEILRRLPYGKERSACACVSKHWLNLLSSITSDESVQEVESEGFLSRSLEGNKATDLRLAAISVGTSSRGGLGKLQIRGSGFESKVTDAGLGSIAHGCPSLKVLSLWNLPAVSDKGLSEIARSCPLIEKLDLSRCPGVTDKGLVAVSESCKNLSDLTIDSCSGVGNEGLRAVARRCTNLRSISLRSCPRIGDQGVAFLLAQAGSYLTKVKLQMLNVTGLSLAVLGHYGAGVTDLVLHGLQGVNEKGFWVMGNAKGMKKLKSFSVTSCRGMTDAGLEAVGSGCTDLKHVSLSKCLLVSGKGLVSLAKSALLLESLKLEECHRINGFGSLGFLMNCGSKLKAFSLVNCLGISESHLTSTSCCSSSSLRSLSVRCCPGFGDASLSFLGKFCHQLQDVELCGLNGVTDAGVLSLLQSNNVGLVKVNLSGCVNVTDNTVSALSFRHGRTLESLNLDGCKNITDASVVTVAKNCYSVNDLDVSNTLVSDHGIKALASSPNHLNLQVLSVGGCSGITDKSKACIQKLGRTLLGLNIQRCGKISSSTVDTLLEQLWRCDILY
ncbi:EIN3-binding F-box protein 2 [Raphanus sativus]|uniref:EIN3-binding F-box protein 2 n=1 Tax=Raphanus sativus TaxID=3726 RepID=A0A9W3CD67_RAPSA|nr:EIN3-binding F-box protein 2 [Raphanus sativus]KAJ4877591.1 EIN3-binding F-box protein 2 [Raphanus sativus]